MGGSVATTARTTLAENPTTCDALHIDGIVQRSFAEPAMSNTMPAADQRIYFPYTLPLKTEKSEIRLVTVLESYVLKNFEIFRSCDLALGP